MGLLESKPRSNLYFWRDHTRFRKSIFEDDIKLIKRWLEKQGYYQANITYELKKIKPETLSILLNIQKNTQIKIKDIKISITNHHPETTEELIRSWISLETDQSFEEGIYLDTAKQIQSKLKNLGFFQAKVDKKAKISLSKNLVDIEFNCTPGTKGRFAISEIRGLSRVSTHIVAREITWKKGEVFSLKTLAKTRQNLQKTKLFDFIQLKTFPLEKHPDLIRVQINLKEAEHRRIQTKLGYASDVGPRGGIIWEHYNLFHRGHRLTSGLEGSKLGARFHSEYLIPYFFIKKQTYKAQFYQVLEDEDLYELNSSELHQSIEREWDNGHLFGLNYSFATLNFDNTPSSFSPYINDIKSQGRISGPGFHWRIQKLNDVIFPSQGSESTLRVESSFNFLGAEYDYWRAVFQYKKFIPLPKEFILASTLRTGSANSIGSEGNLPLSKRFFSGGDVYGRGYRRRSLGPISQTGKAVGGKTSIYSSLELRKSLWGPLAGHLFYDFSQIGLDTFQLNNHVIDQSTGFGLGYRSELGLIRFDLGFPIQKDPKHSAFRLHFGIGYAF